MMQAYPTYTLIGLCLLLAANACTKEPAATRTPAPPVKALDCTQGNGGCSHECTMLNNVVECACPAGLQLNDDAKTCVDINECEDLSICNQGTCINEEQTYRCECDDAWTGANCNDCAPNYFGANCEACDCVYGACSDGNEGTGTCNCPPGFTGERCDQIDATQPPENMRLQVKKGPENRIFVLDRYSVRSDGAIATKIVYEDRVEIHEVETAIRTYRGYCEEEPDAFVTAMVLPSGALRYQVIRGNAKEDWEFIPEEEKEVTTSTINYTIIGGQPDPRSGVPIVGASYTPAFSGDDNIMRTNYLSTISFIINKHYLDEFNYEDHATVIRKAESTIARTNAVYIRDLLMETEISEILIREDESIDWETGRNELARYFPEAEPNFLHTITNEYGSGLAYVCMLGGPGAPERIRRYTVGKSGISNDGTWYGVFRHELGHNVGSNHYEGGAPEGPTILSGNSLARMSSYEVKAIMDCRNEPNGDPSRYKERLNAYDSYPIPPYGRLDHNIEASFGGPALSLDVMANDHDANDQAIAFAGYDQTTDLGGSVDVEFGTGPNGRDRLTYTPPSISNQSRAPHTCPAGEMLDPQNCQTCVSYFDTQNTSCTENSDCGGNNLCVGGRCRIRLGCDGQAVFSTCGELCPSSDFLVWLDSSDSENMESMSGTRGEGLMHDDPIRHWFDRSGNQNDAVTYTEARAPSYHSTGDQLINQRPVMRFENDFVELRSVDVRPETVPALSSIAVFKSLSGSGGKLVWAQQQNGFNKRQQPSTGNPVGEVGLLSMVLDHEQDQRYYWRNGLSQKSSSVPDPFQAGGSSISIGALLYANIGYEGAYHGDFVLAELIIMKRVLAEQERRQIEYYLAEKWGTNFQDAFWYDIVDTEGMMGRGNVQIEIK